MSSPPSLPKRRSQRVTWIVLAVMTLPVLFALGWRWHLMLDVKQRVAAIKAAGLPTSAAELNDYYPAVADDQNAALVITQALALVRSYTDARSNEVEKFELPLPSEPLTSEQAELLAGYVEMNRAAIAKAREGLSLPRSRYPIDLSPGFDALLPHLRKVKDLSLACLYEGMLAVDSGRQEDRKESIVTILSLSHTLADEPILISQMVRFRMEKMAKNLLERSLNVGEVDDGQLAMLERAFHNTGTSNGLARGMIGERAVTMPAFRVNFDQFAELGESPKQGPLKSRQTPVSMMITPLVRATGFLERDLRFYLTVMETNISLAAMEPPKSLAITNVQAKLISDVEHWRYIVSAILVPSLETAFSRYAESLADLRLARTALVVERFRHSKNRLPSSLNELLPDFMPELPADPFDGQSLRYKLLPVGYVIYSIGKDGQDDGGKIRPNKSSRKNADPYDLTFIVER